MNSVPLAYGKEHLRVTLPPGATVLMPRQAPGLPDEAEALRDALRAPIGSPPLRDLVKPGQHVVIVHTDLTRATPNDRVLPPLLAELEEAGVRRDDIALLNALGTHRPQTEREQEELLGYEIANTYCLIQHEPRNKRILAPLGETSLGHPVRVNRVYLEAEVRILTGFIEPHFFAGFSGGPKAVLPGLAGAESVATNHSFEMISHPSATWGVTEGNPVWEEMREVALMTNPTFLLNVALNAEREITGVFAGEMLAAHAEGCRFVREHAMAPVEGLFDIVVTTNSGYPLDRNLYQTVKGMNAAAQITRPGGAIVLAAACADGVPAGSEFADMMREAGSPEAVLEMVSRPDCNRCEQWQAQILAEVLRKCEVHVFSEGLSDEEVRGVLCCPCEDLEATIARLASDLGPNARICVLPEGPQTIPYVRE